MNAAVANVLHYLSGQLERVLNNMGTTIAAGPAAIVRESLTGVEKLVTTHILNPLLTSIGDAVEAILLTMHDEDFAQNEGVSSNSLYMKELHTFIGRAVSLYLSPFDNQALVAKWLVFVKSSFQYYSPLSRKRHVYNLIISVLMLQLCICCHSMY